MKKIKNISLVSFFAFICVMGTFTSCQDDIALKSLPYLFRPINFSYSLNKTVATISWAAVDSAKSYTLQIATDSTFKSLVLDTTITKLSFSKELAGQTVFYAQVRTNANDPKKNSFFNKKFSNGDLFFTTPKENIFLGYGTKNNTGNLYSAYMTDVSTLDIKWTPGANATHLIILSADGSIKDSVLISSSEALAGEKVFAGLVNSTWKVEIFNNKILRGTTYGVVEGGNKALQSGDDISAALTAANSGDVILLAAGVKFPMGTANYLFTKNVKIRGLSVINRPVLCMTPGTASTTSNMIGIASSAVIDSLVFENIDLTGYCDNNVSNVKIGYLFNNKVACTVSNLKFLNCNIHDFQNTPMRLSGGVNQRFKYLVFNGCLISEFGFGSGYALVNISKSADYIDNIIISNSTIYNFSYPLISIAQTAVTAMNSVVISNCTFNQTTQNNASARVLFSFDFMNIANGLTIKNCIFGSTGSMNAGVKVTNSTSPATVITGSYYTSDYVDETLVGGASYSIKASMSAYPGSSTSLWTDPVMVSMPDKADYKKGGDFSLKDTSFKGKGTAGDLRWY